LSIKFPITLCLLLTASTISMRAQDHVAAPRADVAVSFIAARSLKASTSQDFWMEGGSAELGINLWRGIGVVLDGTGLQTGSIGSSGVPLVLTTVTIGPRYRWHAEHRYSIYGQALIGEASGSNSVFPTLSGATSNASSFALQLDGGLDYKLSQFFSIRALNVGYLRTTLPNGTNNVQNTLRLGAGLVFRFGR
jgi:outer membrane immunogenic protein